MYTHETVTLRCPNEDCPEFEVEVEVDIWTDERGCKGVEIEDSDLCWRCGEELK
jgi:hypothetical protein